MKIEDAEEGRGRRNGGKDQFGFSDIMTMGFAVTGGED
jgi:hypothetical protein